MIITSKFSKKGLVSDLSLFLLTVLGLVSFASVSGQELVTTIVLAGILFAIAFITWLFRLKIIVVYEQEIEVRRVCLPFWKHYYRLAEFDSFLLNQSGKTEYAYLLCQGQRVIKLSSDIYENYEELKKTLSVIGSGGQMRHARLILFSQKNIYWLSRVYSFSFCWEWQFLFVIIMKKEVSGILL